MKLQTYVNFGGNCREALAYYEKHLGAKTTALMTFGQMPDPKQVPAGMENAVMHARLEMAGAALMASDVPPAVNWQPMRSAYLTLSLDSNAEAERIFAALKDGGQVFMPMEEMFFAYRFAQLQDRFGINWMILHPKPMA
ncbi:MAG: VOC family protein [Acidobacteria bacterium]|nr:MAG: VOC family protein [Acidobacteriota bacterium]